MENEVTIAIPRETEFWTIIAHLHGKTLSISVGDANQRVKWLGSVAIAQWDEEEHQGWKRLGIPITIRLHKKDGEMVELGSIIRNVMENGDHVYITTSLHPNETS